MATIHPSAMPLSQIGFTNYDLSQLLSRVQRHTRCTAYCLRLPKGAPTNSVKICRFKYPKETVEQSSVTYDKRGKISFTLKRNDPLLNPYHPALIQGWRANCDMILIADQQAIVQYIAKYTSKAEQRSHSLGDILKTIATSVEENTDGRIIFQKLLSRLGTERDYSSQEVCHFLLGCPMYSMSREYRSLCLLPNRGVLVEENDDGVEIAKEDRDWRAVYLTRP